MITVQNLGWTWEWYTWSIEMKFLASSVIEKEGKRIEIWNLKLDKLSNWKTQNLTFRSRYLFYLIIWISLRSIIDDIWKNILGSRLFIFFWWTRDVGIDHVGRHGDSPRSLALGIPESSCTHIPVNQPKRISTSDLISLIHV